MQDYRLEYPISSLNISMRTQNFLEGMGVFKIGQLLENPREVYLRRANGGPAIIREILDALKKFGFSPGLQGKEIPDSWQKRIQKARNMGFWFVYTAFEKDCRIPVIQSFEEWEELLGLRARELRILLRQKIASYGGNENPDFWLNPEEFEVRFVFGGLPSFNSKDWVLLDPWQKLAELRKDASLREDFALKMKQKISEPVGIDD